MHIKRENNFIVGHFSQINTYLEAVRSSYFSRALSDIWPSSWLFYLWHSGSWLQHRILRNVDQIARLVYHVLVFFYVFKKKTGVNLCWVHSNFILIAYVFFLQALLEQERRGVLTPSFKSASWSENSSLMFTSTRKKGCSCPECSTWPTARSKFGSRIGEWKRRSWAGIVCSISPGTLYCKQVSRAETLGPPVPLKSNPKEPTSATELRLRGQWDLSGLNGISSQFL